MDTSHHAAESNSLDVISLLLDHGADMNVNNNNGWTPLHNAVRLLIGGGADIDAEDHSGSTALHYAALNQSHDIARLLIKRGANTEQIDLSWMH